MGGSIDMVQKGFESIACWTHYMTLIFYPTHVFDHGFSRSNFEIAVFKERMARIHFGRINIIAGNIGMVKNEIYIYILHQPGVFLDYFVWCLNRINVAITVCCIPFMLFTKMSSVTMIKL